MFLLKSLLTSKCDNSRCSAVSHAGLVTVHVCALGPCLMVEGLELISFGT